jgi:hypothetical protein
VAKTAGIQGIGRHAEYSRLLASLYRSSCGGSTVSCRRTTLSERPRTYVLGTSVHSVVGADINFVEHFITTRLISFRVARRGDPDRGHNRDWYLEQRDNDRDMDVETATVGLRRLAKA